MALGIIDWGIGGISIYKLIKEQRPQVPVIYFSDTGVTPYGKMSRGELVARLNNLIEFLEAHGATHLVIGCNAASTAIKFLKPNGLKTEGVIHVAVEAAARLKPRRLGLIGGRRTVLSGVYRQAFTERGIRLEQRIAQPLSGLIESGDVDSAELHSACKQILSPLKNCTDILLACTHYPAITNVLKEHVSPQTSFIDPASALVRKISAWRIGPKGSDVFFTSGSPSKMKKAALAAFDCRLTGIEKVRL
ncbi:MAG TPA: aspartate/glutamate racemase family protein [Pyrinomonadaceae bacterium]|nr:aspartate/glutamate racemase family protein [Pyrinomonadaceae bacterium]